MMPIKMVYFKGLILQRYRDLGTTDEKRLAKLKDSLTEIRESVGIVDGTIKMTYDEVIDNCAKTSGKFEDLVKVFTANFEIIDSDEDGVISFQEWVDYYTAIDIDIKHARASFDAMDTNGNGFVSKEEFVAYNK